MRHLKKLLRRPKAKTPLESRPFALEFKRKTPPPIAVPYLFFGYGTLPHFRVQAEKSAADGGIRSGDPKHPIHYFRLREWMGREDPCLIQGGLQTSRRIASALIAAESRAVEIELWKTLFSFPPTHVVHFGWKSQVTQSSHNVLYLPLNFRFTYFGARSLAIAWGDYFLEILEQSHDINNLCPTRSKLYLTQQYWLAVMFFRLRWKVIDQPLEKYRSR